LKSRLLLTVVLAFAVFPPVATGARQAPERDVFAFVRAFDGNTTILLCHPSPPPEFVPLCGQPGVLVMPGQHPAVAGNSTREIGGVRTATVVATPGQNVDSTMLACVEEVFHVFWLRRHTNFRPNEMARIDSELERTTADLLEAAIARANAQPAAFAATEVLRFKE